MKDTIDILHTFGIYMSDFVKILLFISLFGLVIHQETALVQLGQADGGDLVQSLDAVHDKTFFRFLPRLNFRYYKGKRRFLSMPGVGRWSEKTDCR